MKNTRHGCEWSGVHLSAKVSHKSVLRNSCLSWLMQTAFIDLNIVGRQSVNAIMGDMVGIDPLAIEVTKEINEANIKAQEKRCVTWEHEDLAQVNGIMPLSD